MHWRVKLPLLIILSSLLVLSGCGYVLEEVQKKSGNRISIVDDQTGNRELEDLDEENTGQSGKKEEREWINPRPHHTVQQILGDPGEGKYSGSLYDEQKVKQALDQMPNGLSEEKLYAYLLGLVGENYTNENEMIDEIGKVSRQQLISGLQRLWKPVTKVSKAKPHSSPPINPQRKINLVVLLDASNSMSDNFGQKTKWIKAQESVLQLAQSLPPDSTVSVRLYGSRSKEKADSCRKSDPLFTTSKYQGEKQSSQLKGTMSKIRPIGWSPLGRAMEAAYEDFTKARHKSAQTENILFVVTDNAETCQGDPVAISQKWSSSKHKIRVLLFGLQVNARAEKQLQKIAENTLGHFESVRNEQDLLATMKLNIEDIRRVNNPWQLRLSDHLGRKYRSDRNRLTYHYLRINQKVNREFNRLEMALNYLRDKKKVNGRDWVRLSAFVRDRYQQVDGYTKNRLLEIDGKLYQEYTKQSKQLSQSWVKEGKKKADFDNNQKQRIHLPATLPKAK